jgi:hypothetical protein
MSDQDGSQQRDTASGAILEVAPSLGATAQGAASAQPSTSPSGGAVLEVANAALDAVFADANAASANATPADTRKRAVGASAWKKRQEPSEQDSLAQKQLSLLVTDAPVLSVLWPDLSAKELLTEAVPSPELFARRWSELQASLDAVARKGFDQRNQAAVAQSSLDRRRVNLSQIARRKDPSLPESPPLEALAQSAIDELSDNRDRAFVQWAAGLAGAARRLYAQDLSRIEEEARGRGIDRERAHSLLRAEGLDLQEGAARAWSPCVALPGAPSSLDAAGAALLEHPAHGYAAIKRGDVQQWLASNDAPASIIDAAADIRRLSERGASESHVVHTFAWLFGRTEVVFGRAWIRTPSELAPAVRAGTVTTDDLARAARDRVLGAWLRRAGFNAAASASDALGKGEPLGLERLAWALGEPLRIADLSFTDPVTLAQTALATASMREPLTRSFASGELLAWMESLPPSRRDERWIERLRRAKSQGGSDVRALWAGVYGALGARAKLVVQSSNGTAIELVSLRQLTNTHELATVWDAVKSAYRSGELLAWIAAVSPENDYVDQERPADDDAGLNELLWEIGHTGLVLEWGKEDQAITSPDDLVRAYRLDWRWFEAQLRRGYVFRWLERFHGKRLVGGLPLDVLVDRLRAEVPSLPSGFVALKTALLCGMRQLPLDPCEPGDPATFFGYVGAGGQPATAASWEPLRSHMSWGAGHLWIAQLPGIDAKSLPALMNQAFASGAGATRDAPDRLLRALPGVLGAPVPSPALAARLNAATQIPQPPQQPQHAPQPQQPVAQTRQQPPQASSGSSALGVVLTLALLGGLGAGAYFVLSGNKLRSLVTARTNPTRVADTQTCSLDGAPIELGSSVNLERGVHVNSLMDEIDVSWIQSASARSSSEGVGWARLRGRAVLERGTVLSDALPFTPARDQQRVLYRSFATHSATRGQGSFIVDQLLWKGTRREIVACGAVASAQQLPGGRTSARGAALRDPLADVPAASPDYSAMFFCRTAGEVSPFIIAARGTTNDRKQLNGAELYLATQQGQFVRSLAPWPVQVSRVTSAPNPMEALRAQGPASAEAARAGALQAIAVTGRDRVYAWLLDLSHRSVIDSAMLSSNSDPGPARVAVGSNEALVLWVDRQPSGGRAMFFSQFYSDGRRTAPMAVTPLENPGDEPIAPSAAALPDGGYLISWVQRRAVGVERSAWVQRYDRTMRRMGPSLEIARGAAVRTARIAYDTVQGFTVAYAVGDGSVYAVRGRCM